MTVRSTDRNDGWVGLLDQREDLRRHGCCRHVSSSGRDGANSTVPGWCDTAGAGSAAMTARVGWRMPEVDRARLRELIAHEHSAYARLHPTSKRLHDETTHLFGRVPMPWMNQWPGGFPIAFERARGNIILDVDGHGYVDFALGDTGAMAGHSPEP